MNAYYEDWGIVIACALVMAFIGVVIKFNWFKKEELEQESEIPIFHNFAIGDTVKVKSGGPVMTIYYVGSTRVHCFFFMANDHITKVFDLPAKALIKIEN